MKKNKLLRIGILVAVVVSSIVFLIPTFQYYSKTPEMQQAFRQENPQLFQRILNLGLDLQGGMRLVLEVEKQGDEDRDVLDRAYAIIENRVNELGLAEPTIQKQGSDRIIVELPGLTDVDAAKAIIGTTAQLEFKMLRDAAQLQRAIGVIDNAVAGIEESEAAEAEEDTSAEQRQQQELADELFGTAEDSDEEAEEPRESFRDLLVAMGEQVAVRLDHVGRVNEILSRPEVRNALDRAGLSDNSFLWGHSVINDGNREFRNLYYVRSYPEMRGDVIRDARASLNHQGMRAGAAIVNLEMNAQGARTFSSVTEKNTNKIMAIVLDNTVYSAPRINERISGGRAQITGNFTLEEANQLAIILRAGALPSPVEFIEERVVGPSLGQDSIEKGVMAGVVGAALVVLFILGYYKLSGVIAIIALAINMLIVLAVMAGFGATLTLPGIAGLILLIGMAVDANVIIFERIREEIALGKTVRSAIDSGYSSAFVTVMDANLTTLITALILFWQGSGPIRGFAITLIFGIIASLFTALFVSRVMMDLFFQKKSKISI
ncbi:Protein-export membrane protein SecD [Chitinispirillum alkaliphilum]|nr:Protein-export membrane protein SecD [Chitinispirillum alkaliphilum]